jgi:hypothetical protein
VIVIVQRINTRKWYVWCKWTPSTACAAVRREQVDFSLSSLAAIIWHFVQGIIDLKVKIGF